MTAPAPRSIHSPFVQLTNSHSDTTIVGVGETKIELGGNDRGVVAIDIDVEIGKRTFSELEMPNISVDDICIVAIVVDVEIGIWTSSELIITDVDICLVVIVMDVEIGARTSSELKMPNITDDDICIVSDVMGLGDTKVEPVKGMSQKSPIHPRKQIQMKIPSSSSQIPLLQSTASQSKKGGGFGDEESVGMNDDEGIATSQNIPVYPE